jgi:diadenosine tetraphosphate (Ap4A) HIT family hydrolase
MDAACPLCLALIQSSRLAENEHAVAIPDGYPVSDGHSLIISRRHVEGLFELSLKESASLWALLPEVRSAIEAACSPAGFNVGVNVGVAAGQTVGHVHIHVIPRYAGDVDDPRGGVRWVIPERANYWSEPR